MFLIITHTSTDLKPFKVQISKVIQSGGFLGRLAASAVDAGIHKRILRSRNTTLIISNEEMNDIMKIIQALEDSNILIKGVTKTIKMKQNNKKEDF